MFSTSWLLKLFWIKPNKLFFFRLHKHKDRQGAWKILPRYMSTLDPLLAFLGRLNFFSLSYLCLLVTGWWVLSDTSDSCLVILEQPVKITLNIEGSYVTCSVGFFWRRRNLYGTSWTWGSRGWGWARSWSSRRLLNKRGGGWAQCWSNRRPLNMMGFVVT